jgi:DNA (cytosine-5)-methyltransferase 1
LKKKGAASKMNARSDSQADPAPTFGSLFTGIGGMDAGLERAGFRCQWQVEIDPFCQKVLTKRWPDVRRYGDIQKLSGEDLQSVDLVAGGFPCQDVSLAGYREGMDGERSGLWSEMLRIVRTIRPAFVLVENVAGLLVPNPGEPAPIARVLGDLAQIGFDAEWECIPAASVGAPHIRNRVFLLAYAASQHREVLRGATTHAGTGLGLVPQGDEWPETEWSADRKLVDLVPGIHPGTPADWWRAQSRMARSAHGVSDWMDRCAGLGNAVVPQITEWLGGRIKNYVCQQIESRAERLR